MYNYIRINYIQSTHLKTLSLCLLQCTLPFAFFQFVIQFLEFVSCRLLERLSFCVEFKVIQKYVIYMYCCLWAFRWFEAALPSGYLAWTSSCALARKSLLLGSRPDQTGGQWLWRLVAPFQPSRDGWRPQDSQALSPWWCQHCAELPSYHANFQCISGYKGKEHHYWTV